MSLPDIIVILLAASVSTGAGLYFFARAGRMREDPVGNDPISQISLLFNGKTLEHASPAAHEIAAFSNQPTDWAAMRDSLISRFPDLPDQPLENPYVSVLQSKAQSDRGTLEMRSDGCCTQILIKNPSAPLRDTKPYIKALETEAEIAGFAGSTAPYPVWKLDEDGRVVWYNAAYKRLYQKVLDATPKPQNPLFDIEIQSNDPLSCSRVSVQSGDVNKPLWFDISMVKLDGGTMCHANDINAVISAEVAQRKFVQTLAKTFAQLSTGLAIFDRNGQLALFNPALVDLTNLPAEFLSTRPAMLSFFDQLRDNRVMPEPKNYQVWRQDVLAQAAATADSTLQETWSLDTGQTYRISGRPHPDGEIAFLIEDISAEVSLARNFRSELAIGQSMMDTFDIGIAVFSSTGVMQFCNATYRQMWRIDPDNSFVDVTIWDSIKDWQRESIPNPAWADIRDFVMKVGKRVEWDCRIKWRDGEEFICSIKPLALGATLVQFERIKTATAQPSKKQQAAAK
jgi:PAS domain-containing protein